MKSFFEGKQASFHGVKIQRDKSVWSVWAGTFMKKLTNQNPAKRKGKYFYLSHATLNKILNYQDFI